MLVEVIEANEDMSLVGGRSEVWVRAVSFPDELGENDAQGGRVPAPVLDKLAPDDRALIGECHERVVAFHTAPVVDDEDAAHGSTEDWWILRRKGSVA